MDSVRERRKFRVRWWMWAILALLAIGGTAIGALSNDPAQAIFGACLAAIYGFAAGLVAWDGTEGAA